MPPARSQVSRRLELIYSFFPRTAGSIPKPLLQCFLVTDWRQIQARIRKARTSPDPPGQLAALYERTRDAMVAFELAQIHEKAGTHVEAARWYTAAAERFRRAQWKQKAEEALTRLGAPIPPPLSESAAGSATNTPIHGKDELEAMATDGSTNNSGDTISDGANENSEENVEETASGNHLSENVKNIAGEQPSAVAAGTPTAGTSQAPRRKRRGRRGGRGRNKGSKTGVRAATPSAATAQAVIPIAASPAFEPSVEIEAANVPQPVSQDEIPDARRREAQPTAGAAEPSTSPLLHLRVRSGDPALSSRTAKLESQLRRMLACSLASVDQPEDAPAGPGVFLITDSEQTTYYYVEACQTLRVGIGNLLRSGRTSREGADLKGRLAEHLGINESRVGKYLKDHCVVRWLQLDEGAPLLAHFAIAVLRPIAND